MARGQTPSQTLGPFFAYGLTPEQYGYPLASIAGPELAGDDASGERIRIEGRVLDGNDEPVNDAMIEIWHADDQGRYPDAADPRRANTTFNGFGRTGTGTDPAHRYWFNTVKPGTPDDDQAPHVNVVVFMRGLPTHVYTRMYFSDEIQANAHDPVLTLVPEARRTTLIGQRTEQAGHITYCFDIHMQGDRETVFFDF